MQCRQRDRDGVDMAGIAWAAITFNPLSEHAELKFGARDR